MYGTIIGDMVGSPYELASIKTTKFKFWDENAVFTDDTVMTLAVAKGIMNAGIDAEDEKMKKSIIDSMKKLGKMFPLVGYGEHFFEWLHAKDPKPYNSFSNRAPMRIGGIAYFYPDDLERALEVARISAEVSHNHEEAMRAVACVTEVIWLANKHISKSGIKEVVEKKYYKLNLTCDEIRRDYEFDTSCQGTVPVAIQCFLESSNFEEAIRLAVSMGGGDSDTLAAITGSMAEAYYGVPEHMKKKCRELLKEQEASYLLKEIERFESYVRAIEENKPIPIRKKVIKKRFHTTHLAEKKDFEEIVNGRYDIRLFDEKRREFKPNDYVIFICDENQQRTMKKVKEMHVYANSHTLFQHEKCWELYETCMRYYTIRDQYSPMVLIKYND